MSVVPKVYSYAPGATTGAAHVAGIRGMLAAATWWQEQSFLAGVLIASHTTEPWRVEYTPSGANVAVRFSVDGGTSWSPSANMAQGSNTFAGAVLGAATDIAWVVETEDMLTVYTKASGSSVTAGQAGAFSFHAAAGRLFTPDNRSDDAQNVGLFALLVGHPGVANFTSAIADWSLYTQSSSNSRILLGATWEQIRTTANMARGRNTLSTTYWPASNRNLVAPMGDADTAERLAPIRVMGVTSGTVASTRYVRARYYAVTETDSSGLIDSTSVRISAADSAIAWRHSQWQVSSATGPNSHAHNIVHLWAPTVTPVTPIP